MSACPKMRQVTFTMAERAVLVPMELAYVVKYLPWLLLGIFVLSGVGPHLFSLSAAWSRGVVATTALAAGTFSGAILAPVLLPWVPLTTFSGKGAIVGLVIGSLLLVLTWPHVGGVGSLALLLGTATLASFLTMNFTGSTPFTSPTGVEWEMRKALPLQAAALSARSSCGLSRLSPERRPFMKQLRYLPGMSTLRMDVEACIGCGICKKVCPHGVFEMEGNNKACIVDHDGCMECGACARNCPAEAIEVAPGVGCAGYIIQTWFKGTVPSACCGDGRG